MHWNDNYCNLHAEFIELLKLPVLEKCQRSYQMEAV